MSPLLLMYSLREIIAVYRLSSSKNFFGYQKLITQHDYYNFDILVSQFTCLLQFKI